MGEKQVEQAKYIIKKYLLDTYQDKFTEEKADEILNGVKVAISELDESSAGYYTPIINSIVINKNEDINVGTIIHELGHYLSLHVAEGSKGSPFLEEGMANVFVEKCMNHFIQSVDEQTLEEYNLEKGTIYETEDDYIREGDFTVSSLEAVKQITGRHEELEYEYFFGSPEKVMRIFEEALGKDYIDIIESQKGDRNLGSKSDYKYIDALKKVLEENPHKFSRAKEIEDGKVNVYNIKNETFNGVAYQIEVDEKISTICSKIGESPTLENLIELSDKYSVRNPKLIKELAATEKVATIDLIKFMGTFDMFDAKAYAGTIDLRKIASEDIEGLDVTTTETLLSFMMTVKEPIPELLDVVDKIEDKIEHDDAYSDRKELDGLYIKRAKYILDDKKHGEILADMFETLNGVDMAVADTKTVNLAYSVKEDFQKYIEEYAMDDKEGSKKIVEFFADFEPMKYEGEDVDVVSLLYKKDYYKQVYEDLSGIRDICILDEDFSNEVYTNEHYSGNGVYTPKQGATIDMLSRKSRETVFVDVFNETNVIKFLESSGIGTSFGTLTDEEKDIVLNSVATLHLEEKYQPSIKDETAYVRAMLESEENEEILRKKETILGHITHRIESCEDPIANIQGALPYGELDEANIYVLNALNTNLSAKGKDEEYTVALDKIAKVASRTRNLEEVPELAKTTRALLTKTIGSKEYTTDGFISEVDKIYGADTDVLIESYLESVGKDNTSQRAMLKKTISLRSRGLEASHPQFVEYEKADGERDCVLLVHNENGITPYVNGEAYESNAEIVEALNRKKKGILSIFKSKKAKEPVAQSIVLATNEQNGSQVLNIYETGRVEIASMDAKRKVTSKKDMKIEDVGYNPKMIEVQERTGFEKAMETLLTRDDEYLEQIDTVRTMEKSKEDYTK